MTRMLLRRFVLSAALGSHAQAPQRPATGGAGGQRRGGEEAVRERRLLSVPRVRSAGIERHRSAPRAAPDRRSPPSAATSGSPPGQMPPYTAKVVSDTDMANIYAYVQTRLAPLAAQGIPLLREP